MSTIQRTVYLNPVEPAQMSLAVPSGIETKLVITFRTEVGAVVSTDLLAQMELTPRTSGANTRNFAVPATDPVNGKATTVFPAGELTDVNGYRLNLYGSVKGQPALLATGVLDVMASPGRVATPTDVIDTVDLVFDYNEPVSLDIRLWADTGKATSINLTGKTVTADVLNQQNGFALMPFSVETVDTSTVRLTLTQEQVNTLPPTCWWSMRVSDALGSVTLAEGRVTIQGVVEAELTTFTANWDYTKPDTGNPASGKIVHANFTQNLIQVNVFSAGAQNQMSLALVEPGDLITIGASTWTVVQATLDGSANWYNFYVSPIIQDPITGVTAVTFTRP